MKKKCRINYYGLDVSLPATGTKQIQVLMLAST